LGGKKKEGFSQEKGRLHIFWGGKHISGEEKKPDYQNRAYSTKLFQLPNCKGKEDKNKVSSPKAEIVASNSDNLEPTKPKYRGRLS